MRRHAFWTFSLLALALAGVGWVGAAARPAELQPKVYLPLAAQGAVLAELPPPPTAAATATLAPPSATATEPPTIEPSATPEEPGATATEVPTEPPTASPSPTPEPGGRISGKLTFEHQPAPIGTGMIGPGLFLRRCDGPDCSVIARTGVEDEAGRYVFTGVPALEGSAYYQVTWQNEDNGDLYGDPSQIGSWYGPRVTPFDGRGEVFGGDIELLDIALLAPTHGTGFQGLPIHYEWRVRPDEETYRWLLMRGCGTLAARQNPVLRTEPLGRGGSYDLNRYPPNVQWGNQNMYCWYIRAENASGFGESYYARMMWFIPTQLLPGLAAWPGPAPVPATGLGR